MRLLSKGDLQELFPGAEKLEDRFAGVQKASLRCSLFLVQIGKQTALTLRHLSIASFR